LVLWPFATWNFPLRLASRTISSATAPFVIAELGVNHDGSPDKALALAKAAIEAGADAIKLQLFTAEGLMSRDARLAAYQKTAGEVDPLAMLKRLELTIDQMAPVVELAHAKNAAAIVTVFSVELVPIAEKLPWDAYKTASPDIIHRPLLEALAATGRPLILSTGASTLQEVGRALTWLRNIRERLAVLQCVSSYPTTLEDAELPGINAIQDIYPGIVGYSDHTDSIKTGALAVIAGACILEKHVTLDRNAPGPDHASSLTPEDFGKYRKYARLAKRYEDDPAAREYLDTFLTLENEQRAYKLVQSLRAEHDAAPKLKRVLPIEQDVRTVSRQSVVAARDLPAGHAITRADLTFKRPGTGIPPFDVEAILGKTLTRPVQGDSVLTSADLADAAGP
jgi:N,N'-diacetyllegionaminate synthase